MVTNDLNRHGALDSPTIEDGHGRRRILALVGCLFAVVALGFLIANPLAEQASAKACCVQGNGTWDGDAGFCDSGPGGPVLRRLEQSKRCQDVPNSTLRECSYAVDRLKLNVVGVGTLSAAVGVDGADEALGYGVGVFMAESCIRVAPGRRLKELDPMRRIEDGFVSTLTGEVYDSMTMCRIGGLEARRVIAATPLEP